MARGRLLGCADAPGKVILFGEHFVVEGVPAIATAVGLRARACAYEVEGLGGVFVYSSVFDESLRVFPSSNPKVMNFHEVVKYIHNMLGIDEHRDILVRIDSAIPPAAGLGSSAATAVAFAAAYALAYGVRLTPEEASRAAYEAEKIVHGRPSGIDNTIAAQGGTILYRRGAGFERIRPSLEGCRLVIADTGVKRSTRKAVELVLERKRRLRRLGDAIYETAALLVEEARRALEEGDAELLGILMDVNQGLLNAMGVSIPRIEELVYRARRAGAYGAKLTGAGLGGCVIALTSTRTADAVSKALEEAGARTYIAELDAPGLRVEPCRG
ncbi:MAG: mevalonate kinase [Crenarchaeota archaeon]|nr:mevalonate kinase [Thermoproteota archaeon]